MVGIAMERAIRPDWTTLLNEYVYFVAYNTYVDDTVWTSNIVLTRNKPICEALDIKQMELQIQKQTGFSHVVVVNWRRMESPE